MNQIHQGTYIEHIKLISISILQMAVSPVAPTLIACQASGNHYLWDLKTVTRRPILLNGKVAVVNCLEFNHNGQLLLLGDIKGNMHLYGN